MRRNKRCLLLHPTKADMCQWSCPLYPQKRTCAAPDVNRGCRRKCCPSAVQPNCQRPDIAEDEERRLRTRTLCRWLLLVEGHRPPPAEGRQLHQRAESSDVVA